MTLATVQILFGIVMVVSGSVMFVISALISRGRVKPSSIWGRSATEAWWTGIGCLAWGLGMVSRLLVSDAWASIMYAIGAVVFIVAVVVGRRKAAVKT